MAWFLSLSFGPFQLELLFHAFSSGKLPATCNVMDALASCILREGHTIPFDHVLYFMEKALATQGNNVPAERVLDCLSLVSGQMMHPNILHHNLS